MSWQLGSLKTPHLRMRSALVEFSLMTQTSILSTSFGEVWPKILTSLDFCSWPTWALPQSRTNGLQRGKSPIGVICKLLSFRNNISFCDISFCDAIIHRVSYSSHRFQVVKYDNNCLIGGKLPVLK